VISSDIHQLSIHGPLFDLPTCLSKFLALGMSLEEVIAASTSRPAEVLAMPELGTLKPGALADIAVFKLEQGSFSFYDVHMNPRTGDKLLHNTLTLVGGLPLLKTADDPPAPWIELSESQKLLLERGHTPEVFKS
jgi:dihydroorotase